MLIKDKHTYYKYEADQRSKNYEKQKALDYAKYKKIIFLFLGAIFLALLITIDTNFGLIYRKRKVKAKITNINRMMANGIYYSHAIDNYFIEYKYSVASKNYISRFEILTEHYAEYFVDKVKIGDSITIIYDYKRPKISKIVKIDDLID